MWSCSRVTGSRMTFSNSALWVAWAMAAWKAPSSSAESALPGPVDRMDMRCRSSIVARRAASPAASISTALRISMSSAMRSAPEPRSGVMLSVKLGEGSLATLVPWAPRPTTSRPWALSSRRASRTAGRPTPSRADEVALGGDAVARLVLAGVDELAELLRDLVGDRPGNDRLQQRFTPLGAVRLVGRRVLCHRTDGNTIALSTEAPSSGEADPLGLSRSRGLVGHLGRLSLG